MKATSGINAIEPLTGDSRDAFVQDTLKSGGGLSDESLVAKLVDESRPALDWLIKQSEFETDMPSLDLSVVSRCGGHSFGRTHRCPPQNGRPVPVGWKLIDTLKKRFMSLPDTEVLTNTRVTRLLTEQDKITGVEILNEEEKREISANAVVLATGGYGGQTGTRLSDGHATLLSEFAPQLVHTATTNGPWANGDGIRLALAVKAGLRDMVWRRDMCFLQCLLTISLYRTKFSFILRASLTLINLPCPQNSLLLRHYAPMEAFF